MRFIVLHIQATDEEEKEILAFAKKFKVLHHQTFQTIDQPTLREPKKVLTFRPREVRP